MSLATIGSGTQSATISTEHTLVTDTTGKTCVLGVDTGAMVNGDVTILRIYTKMLSGGTERLAYQATFQNVQGVPQKYSVPVPAHYSFKATLQQTAGTGRSYPWEVMSVD